MRKIEGIGVTEDMKNPAKLGISYSYGEWDICVAAVCCFLNFINLTLLRLLSHPVSAQEKICRWFEFCFLFLNITVLPYSPYWILSTDYVNTAVVYSCTDILRLFHVDFAWILGRTRTLPDATIERAREVFAKNNIDVSRMIPSRQQGCDKFL